ncbi:MAG: elongation factor P [Candidatus Omnitrophica bacterium]|nr:elongation factor P [Candidatus Omnitrophota bacterium]MBU1871674.1 elongation factor P [Candidatus Omnitrophota bacterium]
MTVSINELKAGLTILINGEIFSVVDYQHVKPGKGAAFVRTKLRNLKNNRILEKTFRGDEKIEEAFIEERKLQYQYHSSQMYHFMDQESFEDVSIPEQVLGENYKFLKEDIIISAYSFNAEIINISLPIFIELKVADTEPGIKGDTAKSAYKSCTTETGATIQVPLFIEIGNSIKVDTRSGEYVERIN